jgi:hypothetical protein
MFPIVKNVMLASADQVAIDAVSAKMMGFDPVTSTTSASPMRIARCRRPARHRIWATSKCEREPALPRRQESRPHRRRRSDLVRSPEALQKLFSARRSSIVHPRERRLPRFLSMALVDRRVFERWRTRSGARCSSIRADGAAGQALAAVAARNHHSALNPLTPSLG